MSELATSKINDTLQVLKLKKGSNAYRQRLLAMGLTPGTCFTIRRIAPLGCPVEIDVRGYPLILRKHEADLLQLKRVHSDDTK